jgi:hypothetical protein
MLDEENRRIADDEERVAAGVFDASFLEAEKKAKAISTALINFESVINKYLAGAHNAEGLSTVAAWQTGAAMHQSFVQEELLKYDRDAALRQNLSAKANVEILKLSLGSARSRLQEKFSALKEDGDLSYYLRANRIAARVSRDFEDAIDRLTVASEGLRDIYGYLDEFDLEKNAPIEQIDYAVLWARNAVRWLNAFSQLDQSFTTSISLRKEAGANWSDVIDGDAASFTLPEKMFPHHQYVRLRGLAASLALKTESSYAVAVALSPPKYGKIVRTENGTDKSVTLDQRLVPSCLLGAVRSTNSHLQQETAGAISLMNVSPIPGADGDDGSWKVRIELGVIKPTVMDDIIVDLRLTGRPR